jgi:riboflavin synthase
MFTGLVECLGTVRSLTAVGAGRDLVVEAPFAGQIGPGDSVAVNGCCLTVVERLPGACRFQAGPETLSKTVLGSLVPGDRVNLERALRAGAPLGGHVVQGHVDGVGVLDRRNREGEWDTVWFRCPEHLAVQMVPKGSIAVDGVSLTLVEVGPASFSVALIPHTLAATTLGFKRPGDAVNLETDVLAKYVQKAVQAYLQPTTGGSGAPLTTRHSPK